MTGRTHALIGLTTGIAIAAHSPTDNLLRACVIGVALFAGLLPDIDHPRAIISGYMPGVGHAARLIVSHRGATHTAIFAVVIMGLLLLVVAPPYIVAAAGAGIVSHLMADMLTPQGVPLLLPVSRRAFRLAPYSVLWASAFFLEALAMVASVAVIGLVIWGKL
jgi:inner membrane protein